MVLCHLEGRPDMYGLGIRLACYGQWLSACIMEFVHEEDLPTIRLLGFLLSLSITVGNLIQIASHNLEPIDINISLVLSMGIFILVTPIYIWRLATCFNQYLDPLRNSQETSTAFMKISNGALLVTNTGIGIWFYTTYLPMQHLDCDQYGFFLSKMRLTDKTYIAFGSIFFIAIVLCCVGALLVKAGWRAVWEPRERPRRQTRRIQIAVMHEYRIISSLTVFALLVAAIELPIRWNKLDNVNDIKTAVQTIPLFLTLGFIIRVFGSHILHHSGRYGEDGDNGSSGPSEDPDPRSFLVPVMVNGEWDWQPWDPGMQFLTIPRQTHTRKQRLV
ncbi:Fc.00g103410.m01.CDS01 [Cosmosporella sp. VM-42]